MATKFDSPLQWPLGKSRAKRHEEGRFKVTPGDSYSSLYNELLALGGSAVITGDWDLGTRESWPLVKQRAGRDPGVAILITRNGRNYNLATDRYDEQWKNARALALCVEAIRALERHGDVAMMEQALGGFAALPQNAGASVGKRDWWDVLQIVRFDSLANIEKAYKDKVKQYHPDNRETGDHNKFLEVQKAWEEAQEEKGGARG